jgi:hypothetical protein
MMTLSSVINNKIIIVLFAMLFLTGCAQSSFKESLFQRFTSVDSSFIVVPSFNYQPILNGNVELPIVKLEPEETKWGKIKIRWQQIEECKVYSISFTTNLEKIALTCKHPKFEQSTVYYGNVDKVLKPLEIGDKYSWGASFSPDNEHLAYFETSEKGKSLFNSKPQKFYLKFFDIRLARVVNQIEMIGVFENPMDFGQLITWLPDGKHIAFSFRKYNSFSKEQPSMIFTAAVRGEEREKGSRLCLTLSLFFNRVSDKLRAGLASTSGLMRSQEQCRLMATYVAVANPLPEAPQPPPHSPLSNKLPTTSAT